MYEVLIFAAGVGVGVVFNIAIKAAWAKWVAPHIV